MLIPKKVKHRKWHNKPIPKIGIVATRKKDIAFGEHGLKALEASWITARQIEAARRAMTRFVQRGGKIWVRIFPQRPVTIKGGEIRMGGGKGAVDHYVAIVKPGTILFEISGVAEKQAREAMRLASHKLPIKTIFI
ncbi:MAG: 50S ribosomal protein L16 [Candidatus Kerfeldbacteria bacterium RIFOXYA2_FULL_38_24]|uniref:Large ribosomal subunit protein uL16 n=1 Tax=Candidatus Kerfeldbacteria bacterium RIFOXYB2_FULL_38_14 TaxID=1798547 RepID=A0A1G2BF14_9BACT|nr:MAG: 50S ribosomal protein L16 [Candidatus Kerfeldbacteria bacterium RIFOXYB2_FULL_38_14]OGY87932.1 MAG: 50S ribosomal protein L16 [Candidatus Kerfeldbacteria bacterium RIFOXYA2_FULL_38_24]OGY88656.1 MAG: 50S ribosomal protein L16 [Candidatus Kerfeldbacteria bacterium RIFOXYC2_FULL_38_9]